MSGLIGVVIVVVAAFAAGFSGFGYALVATPLLLAAGFPLSQVVIANLLISLATRASVAYRLRGEMTARAWLLIGGSIPGLVVGTLLLRTLSEGALRTSAAVVVIIGALMAGRRPVGKPRRSRATTFAAGLAGGVLGTTTSLSGVPPALLYAREQVKSVAFFADFALYAIGTGGFGVAILALEGRVGAPALSSSALWLPGALLANHVGTTLGLRLSAERLRVLTLGLAILAGTVTLARV